jgi:hypothetical protein
VRRGRLARPLEAVGLDPVDLAGALAGGADLPAHHRRSSPRRGRLEASTPGSPPLSTSRPDPARLTAARAAETDAARMASEAADALDALRRRQGELDDRRDQLTAERVDLEAALRETERALDGVGRELRDLRRDHDRAERAATAAASALEWARAKREALEPEDA